MKGRRGHRLELRLIEAGIQVPEMIPATTILFAFVIKAGTSVSE